ncbi:lipopolysaccharide assembly protein LapB [Staphylococcus sp. 17KM0847]|uniref:tetratricopeptide repeat protein n=1 Tax=Staphylococcus sp. 17KM0847 TaxID=2583989 RepID=UPI0015DD1713|nr:tetratricopeptide repeat protein [Staphylococcus sp. 17KM0847]QLK85538.1 tetratricopeptide repeat protein [Staphylococcus sp. 17KM0847]
MTHQHNIIHFHQQDEKLYQKIASQKFKQQEYSKASHYLNKVLALSPDNFEVRRQLAMCYIKLNKAQQAEALYYDAISEGHELEQSFYELSQLNIRLSEPNKAYLFGLQYVFMSEDEAYRDELERMFDVSYHEEDELRQECQLFTIQVIFQYLFGEGRLLEARTYILKQDHQLQDTRIVRNLLAMCYLYLNENDVAKEMFERLLREDATDIYALCHYTLLLHNRDEQQLFEKYVQILNKVMPMNDDESFKLGIVLSYLKQYQASQQLLLPLHRKGKFQTFQLFHALSVNFYYLGNVEQSKSFWEMLSTFSHAHPGLPPWIIEQRIAYFDRHIAPLLMSEDQHRRLYGLFLLNQLNGKEVLMTKEVWSILETLGDYEKLYLSYLIQGLQLTKLDFVHRGLLCLYDVVEVREETDLFLRWIAYAEDLLALDIDKEKVSPYVAAVVFLYFNTTSEHKDESLYCEWFNVSLTQLQEALKVLMSI